MFTAVVERAPVLSLLGLALLFVPSGTPAKKPSVVIASEDGAKQFGGDFAVDGSRLVAFDYECTGRKGRCFTKLRIFEIENGRARQTYRDGTARGMGLYALSGDTFVQRHRTLGHERDTDELWFLERTSAGWVQRGPLAVAPACESGDWDGAVALRGNLLVASSRDAACIYDRAGDTWQHTATLPIRSFEAGRVTLAGPRVVVTYPSFVEVYERSDGWARRLVAPPPGESFWEIQASDRWMVARTGKGETSSETLHVYDLADGTVVTTLLDPPDGRLLPAHFAVSDDTIVVEGATVRVWRYDGRVWRARGTLEPTPASATEFPRRLAIGNYIWVGEEVHERPHPRGGTIQGFRVE